MRIDKIEVEKQFNDQSGTKLVDHNGVSLGSWKQTVKIIDFVITFGSNVVGIGQFLNILTGSLNRISDCQVALTRKLKRELKS